MEYYTNNCIQNKKKENNCFKKDSINLVRERISYNSSFIYVNI